MSKSKYGEPCHMIPITSASEDENDKWYLVITTTGNKYYYNSITNENTWEYPLLGPGPKIDRDDLVLMIAWCRGLKLRKADHDMICEKYLVKGDIEKEEQEKIEDEEADEEEEEEEEEEKAEEGSEEEVEHGTEDIEQASGVVRSGGLITGYESSSDEDSDHDEEANEAAIPVLVDSAGSESSAQEEKQGQQQELSAEIESDSSSSSDSEIGEGGGVDFDLDDLDEDNRQDEDPDADADADASDDHHNANPIEGFKNLLDRYKDKIDAMSTYESQVKVLVKEPEFFNIGDYNLKKKLFNEWCLERITNSTTITQEEEQEEPNDRVQDIKNTVYENYPYLRVIDYLNEKYGGGGDDDTKKKTKKLFWIDFKRKYKDELIENQFDDDLKEFEKIYKKFVIHHDWGCISSSNRHHTIDEYYEKLRDANKIEDVKFMNDIDFHAKSLSYKLESFASASIQ